MKVATPEEARKFLKVARLREIEKAEELRSSLSSRGGKVGSPFGLVRSLAYSIFGVNGAEMPEREIGVTKKESKQ